jgi:6-phosphogluconolactonase
MVNWRVFDSLGGLAAAAMGRIERSQRKAVSDHRRFDIVLAGGTTPGALYRALRAARLDWPAWQVWFGDERCLPAGHRERNDTMARKALLDHVPVPPSGIHAIPAQLGPEAGAQAYAAALAGVGMFDLVLLGIGEDGHTAGLFPGRDPGDAAEAPDVLPVRAAPKPPPERVSLSARRLSRSQEILVLASGRAKREALRRWRAGDTLPIAALHPLGQMDVYCDREAFGGNARASTV